MAFCARYDGRSQYLFDIDELIIPFHERKDNLAEFLEAHVNQRIIIDIKENWKEFYAAILQPIMTKFPNSVLRFHSMTDGIAKKLHELNLPFFVSTVATNWEVLYRLTKFGVTDIYIGEQLCFELKDVTRAARKWKFRVRVFPNVAQYSIPETESLKRFFVRPEDVDIYNRRYISTFEFFIPENVDLNWDSLYRIYAINKKWRGPLSEIIQGFDSDLISTFVSPRWAEFRMVCGRSCFKGSNCNMCNTLYDFSKSLAAIEVMPKPPKDTKAAAKAVLKEIDTHAIDSITKPTIPKIPNF